MRKDPSVDDRRSTPAQIQYTRKLCVVTFLYCWLLICSVIVPWRKVHNSPWLSSRISLSSSSSSAVKSLSLLCLGPRVVRLGEKSANWATEIWLWRLATFWATFWITGFHLSTIELACLASVSRLSDLPYFTGAPVFQPCSSVSRADLTRDMNPPVIQAHKKLVLK